MRLADLKPRWLDCDGQHVGIIFQCPHCVSAGKTAPAEGETWHNSQHVTLLTCFFQSTPKREQFRIIQGAGELLDEDGYPGVGIVTCNPAQGWSHTGDSFDNLSITPSIDASAAGDWHGFITNGEIK